VCKSSQQRKQEAAGTKQQNHTKNHLGFGFRTENAHDEYLPEELETRQSSYDENLVSRYCSWQTDITPIMFVMVSSRFKAFTGFRYL